jgi:hypothetical protein
MEEQTEAEAVVPDTSVPFSYGGATVSPEMPAAETAEDGAENEAKITLIQNLEEKSKEADKLKSSLDKTKQGLTTAIVLGIAAVFIAIMVGYSKYEEADSARWNQVNRYNTLNSQHTSLQTNYDTLLKNWVISVNSISVGNTYANYQWINRPGEKLTASEIRYLSPEITYNSRISGEVTLYVKLIGPNGQLKTGASSPAGYTYLDIRNISRGNDQSWALSGWGNSNQSNYSPGKWTVEIWFEGICIGSTAVTLN